MSEMARLLFLRLAGEPPRAPQDAPMLPREGHRHCNKQSCRTCTREERVFSFERIVISALCLSALCALFMIHDPTIKFGAGAVLGLVLRKMVSHVTGTF